MKYSFLFSFIFFPYLVFATNYFQLFYKDEKHYVIDYYRQNDFELQEKTKTETFTDKNEWQNKIKSLKKYRNANDKLNLVDTEDANQFLWKTEGYWDLAWEKKFSAWITSDFNDTFFKKYQIATDCADVMISLRWIFSRINHLAMGSTLAGSNVLLTNESFKNSWSNLPRHELWYKDQLFLTALDYILENSYTNSLWNDSLPIKINPDFFRPGIFLLFKTLGDVSGHTQVVVQISDYIKLYQSTTPRRIRNMITSYAFPELSDENYNSIRSMRWVRKNSNGKNILLASNLHPHYSLEQFDPQFAQEFSNFYNALLYHLGLPYNQKKHLKKLKKMLKMQFKERKNIVLEGYDFCKNNDCTPGNANYEGWSTPSRDHKILDTLKKIDDIINKSANTKYARRYKRFLKWHRLKIKHGAKIRYNQLREIFLNQKYSSDPNMDILRRWGLN